MIDNLGGRLGSFDRLEKELADGSQLVGVRPRAGRRGVLRHVRRAAYRKGANSGDRARGRARARHAGRGGGLRWAFVAKDTEKLIRQLSLIAYLMAERRPVTATEIRRDVEGYSDMTEDAFARRFYADRAELDSLGIHLTVDRPADGFSEQENYSLAPEAFFLPSIAFTDAELAALQTALSLLDGEFAYAEPLRLALQQLTWGRPSPLGSPAPARDRPRHHRLGGRRRAVRAAREGRHRDLPPQADRVRVLHDAARRRPRCARSIPTSCCSRAASSTSSATRTSAATIRVFRLSRIHGKVAYATKAEHDFQRPRRLRPARVREPDPVAARRGARHRRDLGLRPASPGTSSATSAATARWSTADDGGRVFRTGYAIPRLVIAWAIGYGSTPASPGRPSWSTRRASGSTRSSSCIAASRRGRRRGRAARARAGAGGERAPAARARRPRSGPSASRGSSRSPRC